MTPSQSAKQHLISYRRLKEEIARIENELTEMHRENAADSRALMLRRHNKLRELSEQCLEIDREIEKLPPLERTILRYRYIFGVPWEDVCEKIGYEFEQAVCVHEKALITLSKDLR
jgi:DNA-directed RNA polymerase specialized sigma24 family protein